MSETETTTTTTAERKPETFQDFDLEPRIMKGISHLKYEKPTLIQEISIPLALKGKDILAKVSLTRLAIFQARKGSRNA